MSTNYDLSITTLYLLKFFFPRAALPPLLGMMLAGLVGRNALAPVEAHLAGELAHGARGAAATLSAATLPLVFSSFFSEPPVSPCFPPEPPPADCSNR